MQPTIAIWPFFWRYPRFSFYAKQKNVIKKWNIFNLKLKRLFRASYISHPREAYSVAHCSGFMFRFILVNYLAIIDPQSDGKTMATTFPQVPINRKEQQNNKIERKTNECCCCRLGIQYCTQNHMIRVVVIHSEAKQAKKKKYWKLAAKVTHSLCRAGNNMICAKRYDSTNTLATADWTMNKITTKRWTTFSGNNNCVERRMMLIVDVSHWVYGFIWK